ncbi:MAG: PDDEXK nuclease domain-containing protein [Verrucomicrobia bacterium]|nr:PDDEXK nuclease domain-containing protein [Verrucomicrobiota bacterium]
MKKRPAGKPAKTVPAAYTGLIGGIGKLLESSRGTTARAVNSLMTATYWEVGRRIVEFEQGGKERAGYGEELLKRLAEDLTAHFGKGFSYTNLNKYRQFYLVYPAEKIGPTLARRAAAEILPTVSGESKAKERAAILPTVSGELGKSATASRKLTLGDLAKAFPLPWSHYVLLVSARSPEARDFYHAEALRGGWSVRQLDRQMNSLFYERTALSKNKPAMLEKGARPQPGDVLTAEEAIRDPLVLEFLNLRDEYSETELEGALAQHLETFLLELGSDFAFVGRQRRLRIDDEWYRIDLLFFHRRLRCLVIVDLKLGKFTHADAGQMHLYLSYAKEHWTHPEENPPVGLILCSGAAKNLVHYTLDTLPSKVLAREYKLALPNEGKLAKELAQARKQLEARPKA